MIYFVHLKTSEQVHAQALGFTNDVFFYARGDCSENAGLRAVNWFVDKYNIGAKIRTVSPAIQQEEKRYCFPEQII
jgi:hypothetical protein